MGGESWGVNHFIAGVLARDNLDRDNLKKMH